MRQMLFLRHGSTKLNGDLKGDKIRGWLDVPLDERGKQEAKDAAEKLKGSGIQSIVSSDFKRAADTAKVIGKATGAPVTTTQKLRPWNLGKFNGQASQVVHPEIKGYVNDKPNAKVPGGESFNDFKKRAFSGLSEAFSKNPGKKVLVVSHHRMDRLIGAWQKAGQPADHSIDTSEFDKKGTPPGEVKFLNLNEHALAGVQEPKLAHIMPALMGLFGGGAAQPQQPQLAAMMPEEK